MVAAVTASCCTGAVLSELRTMEVDMNDTANLLLEEISHAVQTLDFERTYHAYWNQNECVFFEQFLPSAVIEHHLLPEVERLRAEVHRNYIPKHKKGGSVSSYILAEKPPFSSTCTAPRRSLSSSVVWWALW
jgi:hypothetical protein